MYSYASHDVQREVPDGREPAAVHVRFIRLSDRLKMIDVRFGDIGANLSARLARPTFRKLMVKMREFINIGSPASPVHLHQTGRPDLRRRTSVDIDRATQSQLSSELS